MRKTKHSVYNINYHIVFCPKYRHHIFKAFPNLKKNKFWNSGLWSKGYYIGTARAVSSEIIKKYIQEQKLK
ncbi:transposase [Clostridium algidicarnis]|uniref:transposase n=1 Tax=Clostridium algidicarnis TaxID=37659 RepID=UPI001C0C96D9|nr:transposase [Clostridium algidicarnis]MBU3206500.1 transposase [Clostridium algidicarnis]MBU3212559.1 transposase [Clostridium algidicarnis]MBU3222990.1 transposase [Clostridium algidicarnis]